MVSKEVTWFADYLYKRKQYVLYNRYNSYKSDHKKYLMLGTTRLNIGSIIIYIVCKRVATGKNEKEYS